MLLWGLSFIFLFLGMKIIFSEIPFPRGGFGISQEIVALKKVIIVLHEIQETLEAGLVPDAPRWFQLAGLRAPWGKLASESLETLRAQGGSVLPTLRRIRNLAEEHETALKEAQAKSAQALAQTFLCSALVPFVGSTLYFILPGLSLRPWLWGSACALATGLSFFAALWLLNLTESARWGGLKSSQRSWILAAQCSGERFLALVRSGVPADLAWSKACEFLLAEAPGLAHQWGISVWVDSVLASQSKSPSHLSATGVILTAGDSIRKSIQLSLMEGRPCIERVETALFALRQDIRAKIAQELGLLPTRALVPLFTCVAPALLGLLGFGFFLAWLEIAGGRGGFI